ncbi:MAG: GlxA family transcriptional regulator [Verrucomicrobiota bacterium JB022]|nr:GlxA family transcriptional regulator [Verrucomicrobiota bacterium JB022]
MLLSGGTTGLHLNGIKHIALLVAPGVTLLDVAGPADVFSKAADCLASAGESSGYRVCCIAADRSQKVVRSSSGIPVNCDYTFDTIDFVPDTILVTGRGEEPRYPDAAIDWLKSQFHACRRMGSICAGAFVLAECGFLSGRRVTTHWAKCEELARLYPDTRVEKDPIFLRDEKVYTSAGVSAGIDLSLAMVEEDYGREVALQVARLLVLFMKRPGNQSQFSVSLAHQHVDYLPVRQLLDWLADHYDQALTIESLAERARMSPRNFARVFAKETGDTPAKFLEKLRVEKARQRLEESRLSLDRVAMECGLTSADTMRKMFLRHLGVTPSQYRERFTSCWGSEQAMELV